MKKYTFSDEEKQETLKPRIMRILEHTDLDNHLVKSRPRRAGLPIRPVYKGNL